MLSKYVSCRANNTEQKGAELTKLKIILRRQQRRQQTKNSILMSLVNLM